MPISLDLVTFGLLALSGITAASFAVAHRRPLLGAFALLISALSVAALMAIFLRAPIAAVALISLQGALAAAIYVFSVSTLDDGQLAGQIDKGRTGPSRARAVAVGAVTAGFVIMVAVAFFDAGSSMRIVPAASDSTSGDLFASRALVPFVITGFVLLAALVGIFQGMRAPSEEGERSL
jgi:NADH:ubiquinone oxidoreductase subunit 6 (subunit J)